MILLPFLHPELLPADAPADVLCLDPGLADPGPRHHRPADLPLAPAQAARLLDDWQAQAQLAGRPGDLSAWARFSPPVAAESDRSIAAALEGAGPGQDPAEHLAALRQRAQLYLLLAWRAEARLLELHDLDSALGLGRRRFFDSLGFADEDLEDLRELGAAPLNLAEPAPLADLSAAWPRTLEAMRLLAPEVRGYFVADPDVLADLETLAEKAGAAFMPADRGLLQLQLPAAALGLDGPPVVILRRTAE